MDYIQTIVLVNFNFIWSTFYNFSVKSLWVVLHNTVIALDGEKKKTIENQTYPICFSNKQIFGLSKFNSTQPCFIDTLNISKFDFN